MDTINKKQHAKSTPKFCKLCLWDYVFEREADYYPELLKRYVKTLSSKRIKSFEVPICGTIAMPLGMAIATWTCTLPNIKRIYICDDKCHAKYMAECSKKAKVPLITKDPRSLIPYDVFPKMTMAGITKIECFGYDTDIRCHSFCSLKSLLRKAKITTDKDKALTIYRTSAL